VGFFLPAARALWREVDDWLRQQQEVVTRPHA
jgi:hypothetical protein